MASGQQQFPMESSSDYAAIKALLTGAAIVAVTMNGVAMSIGNNPQDMLALNPTEGILHWNTPCIGGEQFTLIYQK